MNSELLHQLRCEYLDAAIAEINAVCNVMEADNFEQADVRGRQAEQVGIAAQEKFNIFRTACIEFNGGFDVLDRSGQAADNG
jgi:hypothetical protein